VQAERAVSRALGGSCSMPLAAHAQWQGEMLSLRVVLGHAHTPLAPLLHAAERGAVRTEAQARELGERAARTLRHAGADDYLAAASAPVTAAEAGGAP
jgi:hydroxymethylbilane synthase